MPLPSTVVVCAVPPRVIVAPAPRAAGVTVPEMLPVSACAVKLTPDRSALLTVADWFTGVNERPVFRGVTR